MYRDKYTKERGIWHLLGNSNCSPALADGFFKKSGKVLEGESAELGYFCPLRTKTDFSGSSTSLSHVYSSVPFYFSSRFPLRFFSLRFNLAWCALLGPFSAQQVCRSCSAAHPDSALPADSYLLIQKGAPRDAALSTLTSVWGTHTLR